jgi:hypothetical protein
LTLDLLHKSHLGGFPGGAFKKQQCMFAVSIYLSHLAAIYGN